MHLVAAFPQKARYRGRRWLLSLLGKSQRADRVSAPRASVSPVGVWVKGKPTQSICRGERRDLEPGSSDSSRGGVRVSLEAGIRQGRWV